MSTRTGQTTAHPPKTKPFKQVGFYGCTDRIVRVRSRPSAGLRKGRTEHRVDCPACKRNHRISVMWRRANKREAIRGEISV